MWSNKKLARTLNSCQPAPHPPLRPLSIFLCLTARFLYDRFLSFIYFLFNVNSWDLLQCHGIVFYATRCSMVYGCNGCHHIVWDVGPVEILRRCLCNCVSSARVLAFHTGPPNASEFQIEGTRACLCHHFILIRFFNYMQKSFSSVM